MWRIRLAAVLLVLLSAPVLLASPSEAVAAALADARMLPVEVQRRTRYLDLCSIQEAERLHARKVIAFQVNSLSQNSELVQPRLVRGDLLAVVLDDYGWKSETWETLAGIDPYYHAKVKQYWPGGTWDVDGQYYKPGNYAFTTTAPWLDAKAIAELVTLTQSQVPVVRADWWFVQTARQLSLSNKETGAGYYDWLGLDDRKAFERLIRLRARDSVELGKEIRAAVEKSGVANENRQIVRLQALTGGAWVTLDTNDSTGKGNAIRNLGKGDYVHQAEEHFGVLPNGLFVTFLCDADGVRQNSAPDFVGGDDSPLRRGRDTRIHVHLACIRCHGEHGGLQPIDDWARRHLGQPPLNLQAVDYAKAVELRRQYFSNLNRALQRDRDVFVEALVECNGLTPKDNAVAFARFWDGYVQRSRTVEDVARETGLTADEVVKRLRASAAATGIADTVLSVYLETPPGAIRVEHYEEAVPVLYTLLLIRKVD